MNRRGFLGMIAAAFLPKPKLPAATLAAPFPEEAFQSNYSNRITPNSDLNVENLMAALEEFQRMRDAQFLYVPRSVASHAESLLPGKVIPVPNYLPDYLLDPTEWYLTVPTCREFRRRPGAAARSVR